MASPCRLFVYLAREAAVSVILRRGPSDWARLSVWHLDDDRIEHGPLTLTMLHTLDDFRRLGGPYVVEYAVAEDGGRRHAIGEASWADWDPRGRLVVARDGRLLAWDVDRGFEAIADFNDQTPDPQPAPEWATEWPPPTAS